MALALVLGDSSGDGTLILTDVTVYGDSGNPERADVTVAFSVLLKLDGEDKEISLPEYDQATVAAIEFPAIDGYYIATMVVTENANNNSTTKSFSILRTTDTAACMAVKEQAYIDSACGCDPGDQNFDQYLKLKVNLDVIDDLVLKNNYLDARCLLDGISTLCNNNCKGC